jgi:hypothetical protein
MLPVEQEFARGMRFTHLMALAMQRQGDEAARLVQELSKLLIDRGIFSDAEWAEAFQKQNLGDAGNAL